MYGSCDQKADSVQPNDDQNCLHGVLGASGLSLAAEKRLAAVVALDQGHPSIGVVEIVNSAKTDVVSENNHVAAFSVRNQGPIPSLCERRQVLGSLLERRTMIRSGGKLGNLGADLIGGWPTLPSTRQRWS
jgi:hypothetical protein